VALHGVLLARKLLTSTLRLLWLAVAGNGNGPAPQPWDFVLVDEASSSHPS